LTDPYPKEELAVFSKLIGRLEKERERIQIEKRKRIDQTQQNRECRLKSTEQCIERVRQRQKI
jgi:hypothetical protein